MISVAIQAGGESRRMGQNKALMPFAGQALIQVVAGRLAGLSDDLFIAANQPGLYAFLGLPVHPDETPGQGPLGGLATALRVARHPLVGVVACDMPFASPALLRYEAELLIREDVDVVAPVGEAGLEPLHAVYRAETCLPAVQAALRSGRWKLSGWFERARVRQVPAAEWAVFDPQRLIFVNLNTPAEFRAAELQARERGS